MPVIPPSEIKGKKLPPPPPGWDDSLPVYVLAAPVNVTAIGMGGGVQYSVVDGHVKTQNEEHAKWLQSQGFLLLD